MPPDVFMYGKIANNISRTHTTDSSELDQLRSSESAATEQFTVGAEDTDVGLVGVDSRNPGDLVELRHAGSRIPVFAIYLGFIGDRNHFYATNGKWITSTGFSPLFTVSKFASQAEINPVVAKIPADGTPEDYDALRSDERGPSREDGAVLIQMMNEFRNKAESTYQASLAKLDDARSLLSDDRVIRHLSLFDIADVLLPSSVKVGDSFPPWALYAVHTALSRSETGFYPVSPSSDCHRRDHLFEIFPHGQTEIANKIAVMVRQYTESSAKRLRPLNVEELEQTALGKFILQCREAVWASRKHRDWTPHGIIHSSAKTQLPKIEWSQASREVITFLEWWANYDLFDTASRFHACGALILRATGLYNDAVLDQSTAWTLLQEIGVLSPWEVPSRYKIRFPDTSIVRGGGLAREQPANIETSKRLDIAAGSRRSWSGARVFCIDAPSTMVIDDGVSVERTENEDEFWIHVHTADPASSILPNSELGKFMELIPENIYLPGHFQAMLPTELGEDDANDYNSEGLVKQFSLRAGGPALTFSAKVNSAGDVLDYKIQPGTLDGVEYLDPTDVSAFCKEPSPPPSPIAEQSLTVGSPSEGDMVPTRVMTATRDLDEANRNDLLLLYRLAEAVRGKRLAKGAWPYFFPRPSVSVSFHSSAEDESFGDASQVTVPADPYINVGYESSAGCSVVSNTMVLAGEIAARWCSDRGIPVPYRKDSKSGQNFDEAFAYAANVIYPRIRQGIEPSMGQRQELAKLTGGIDISAQPGPYFLLGLDMYAKATSPLRRFSDLVLHWQVHAALVYERETGRRIDSAIDNLNEVLPFTSAQLASTLPLLQMREKMARVVSRGSLDWILMALVRAWRFEKSAPPSLVFTVGSRWRHGLLGQLDLFTLNASMGVAELDGCRLIKDVQVGDQFEVELTDVNVHSRQIVVKALKYLGTS